MANAQLNALDRDPVFIVGCPRSGTTLLQRMLDAHSMVAVAGETHFIRRFYLQKERYGDLATEQNWRRIVADVTAVPEFADMKLDAALFAGLAEQGERTYASLFRQLLLCFAQARGVRIVGEKTPNHVEYAPILLRFFPKAKFVHIVRDPRAVVNSWRSVPWSTGSLQGDAWVWRTNVGVARRYPPQVQRSFHTLYYETLVDDPEPRLRELCQFLDLPFEPGMLEFHQAEPKGVDVSREPWKADAAKPVDAAATDKWKRELTPAMIASIEAVAWREMGAHDYERITGLPRLLPGAFVFAAKRLVGALRG